MIFIFGHTGFVGQHLTNYFNQNNIRYKKVNRDGLDNFNFNVSKEDTFINLIGHAHSKINDKKTYEKFIDSNIRVVDKIIFLAKKFNISKLIHLSSLRVYVNSYLEEIKVDQDCLALPDTIYGQSKLAADIKLIEFEKNSKTKVIILRPPLIYGKNVKGNLKLLIKLCKFSFFVPFKNNLSIRSILSVTNLCHLIKNFIFLDNNKIKKIIYHPRDSSNLSIYEIVKKIIKINNFKCIMVPFPFNFFKIFLASLGAKTIITQLFKSVYISKVDIDERFWKPDENIEKNDFRDSMN